MAPAHRGQEKGEEKQPLALRCSALCRHYHGQAGHALVEPWYDSPMPSYAPPARVVPRDRGKGSQTGKQGTCPILSSSPEPPWHVPSSRPGSHECLSLCFFLYVPTGPSDPKEDGLEGQISRLAALIGRLEDKVRGSAYLHQCSGGSEGCREPYLSKK